MKILFLTFYFDPDLCAGSFRNTPLAKILSSKLDRQGSIEVFTTKPNRYSTYSVTAPPFEDHGNLSIHRLTIPMHSNGFMDQIFSFWNFYKQVVKKVKSNKYDLIYASSSRLFTAYLGAKLSRSMNTPLYLDIRDIFSDSIKELLPWYIRMPIMPCLRYIENRVFRRAKHINLVSEGFKDYFKKYDQASFSYFTNGIDDEFVNFKGNPSDFSNIPLIVTYAGNLGEGQGLHYLIPEVAKSLSSTHHFRIIGDGGCREKLATAVNSLENVELIEPVSRKELLEYYQETHFLMVHLNDLTAFEKVLPSKLFEYGALTKPIIAGVNGYAATFIKENLPDTVLFKPRQVQELVSKLTNFNPKPIDREEFINKFRRAQIMDKMSQNIIDCTN